MGETIEAKTYLEKGIEKLLEEDYFRQAPSGLQVIIDGYSELADLNTREGNFSEAMSELQKGMGLLSETGYKQHPTLWLMLS